MNSGQYVITRILADRTWATRSPSCNARPSVTWWRAPRDANAPLTAATRLIDRLPNARLAQLGEHEGHLAAYHREGEILNELLAGG